jgi:two-component system, NtrC family, response regulator AtoC
LGNGEKMRGIATVIEQVADSDVTVLIRGESGVGKELVARAIHDRSTRRNRTFVKVNCAALPAELLESELFGHARGAFTGAATTRIGKFEQADRGTLMLDEIGEMKPALQAKMLHVLQDGEFTKLGSNNRIQVDVRVVAATNRDLEQMLGSGEFRKDLYYRLKVIEILVPPLRERRDEIPTLTDYFIDRYSKKYNRPMGSISDELRQLFQQYDWQGNVRELENMIKRAIILQDEQLVIREIQRHRQRKAQAAAVVAAQQAVVAVPATAGTVVPAESANRGFPYQSKLADNTASVTADAGRSLVSVAKTAALKAERAAIEQALRQVNWNRRKAAVNLGVSYKTLLNRIKWCGISRV